MAIDMKVEDAFGYEDATLDNVTAMIARLAKCDVSEIDEDTDFEDYEITYDEVALECFYAFNHEITSDGVEVANTCTLLQAELQT